MTINDEVTIRETFVWQFQNLNKYPLFKSRWQRRYSVAEIAKLKYTQTDFWAKKLNIDCLTVYLFSWSALAMQFQAIAISLNCLLANFGKCLLHFRSNVHLMLPSLSTSCSVLIISQNTLHNNTEMKRYYFNYISLEKRMDYRWWHAQYAHFKAFPVHHSASSASRFRNRHMRQ